MPRYDNIFLNDTADTYNFSSAPKLGGKPKIPQRSNRQAHSNALISQLREAQNYFKEYTPQQVAAISYNTGTYVEFSGAENCDLLTKSLEDSRQGIKLLNVRDVLTQATDDSDTIIVAKATVFIPTGKEEVFIKKISEFATEQTQKGNPKNNDLVSSIESISDAIKISAFWVGRPSEMPDDTEQWFEIWIDIDENRFDETKRNAFDILNNLNLTHRPETEFIRFPERLVIPIFANRTNLLDLIRQGITIAEIRRPADPNAFFLDSSLQEQDEWADDLLARTHFNDTGVAVCVLDTGINGNHKLISPYMPTTEMTIDQTWGNQDRSGHGTNMAVIRTLS